MSTDEQSNELNTRSSEFWADISRKKAWESFQAASQRVPAYKKFLKQHGISPEDIRSAEDFHKIPVITKDNYLKKYPLKDLCWDGNLSMLNVISVSSGTTGTPFFWPRDMWQEKEVDSWYGLTYRYLFNVDDTNSLVVICFAMGMYIAGPFTFASTLRIAQKGCPITITTPGTSPEAVLRLVREIGGQFGQVILGGYPPLIKEILDLGMSEGIDWKKYRTKLFFGGEAFSEQWRDHISDIIGAKGPYASAINMYGTADSALLGIESPASIALRRMASKDKDFALRYFSNERIPSVVTYNPLFKYFEVDESDALLFTSSSGIPLIRYRIGDTGGIIPYSQAISGISANGQEISDVLARDGLQDVNWQLPILYLFGRSDFTVQLYGANVYPENIKEGLDDSRINRYVSGKFMLATEYSKNMDPYLDLVVELAPGADVAQNLADKISAVLVEVLRRRNSEYEVIYNTIGEKAVPKVKLEVYGHEAFKINIKHRWTSKRN